MTEETIKLAGRIVAGAYYDTQGIRICTLNRIRDVIRKKIEGVPFDQKEEKKEEKDFEQKFTDEQLMEYLEELRTSNELSEREHKYIERVWKIAKESMKIETRYKQALAEYIEAEPIWNEFLVHIKGISSVLASNLIKEYGYCERHAHISALYAHSGVHVKDGKAVRRQKGVQANYDPGKKVLLWKIGDSFIKQRTPFYRDIYDKEKAKQVARMEAKEEGAPERLLQAHYRAMRKMVKLFMSHYFEKSKQLTGQEYPKPWILEHGGHVDYISPDDIIKKQIAARKSKELGSNRIETDTIKATSEASL